MENSQHTSPNKIGCLHVLLAFIVILLTAILCSIWWMKQNLHATEFKPVELNEQKTQLLDAKLNAVDPAIASTGPLSVKSTPEAYTEDDAHRKVVFSQDELNAVLAKDPEFAKRVKFNLSDDLVSIQFIAPFEQEMPLLGGKTLKFNMGLYLSYTNSKPSVAIRGISLGGIPLPAAWWGDIKNKNLVEEFGTQGGFWETFSRGVEFLEVKDGQFILHLKE